MAELKAGISPSTVVGMVTPAVLVNGSVVWQRQQVVVGVQGPPGAGLALDKAGIADLLQRAGAPSPRLSVTETVTDESLNRVGARLEQNTGDLASAIALMIGSESNVSAQ